MRFYTFMDVLYNFGIIMVLQGAKGKKRSCISMEKKLMREKVASSCE